MSPSAPKKSLADLAKSNPTQLGDPVSLKAETSSTTPTDQDKPNKSPDAAGRNAGGTSEGKKTLAEAAMSNPTMLGDPVSLKAEVSASEVTEEDRGARGVKGKPHSSKI